MSQLDTFPNLRVFVQAIQLESCRYSGFYSSWLWDTSILFVNHDAAGASIVQPLAVYTRPTCTNVCVNIHDLHTSTIKNRAPTTSLNCVGF